ncbi:interferon-induced protein 44-like [Takifugu flavidus]|uniref:interferon-induced protein 44-like n=1 Tax=Takifugu flavidus TaxID=433684 RepID=UPI0025449209|nr:interferon-induced protein 44-like [Takifugu flavidus]
MDQLVLESPVSSTLLKLFYKVKSLAELSQMEICLKAPSPRNTKTTDSLDSLIQTAIIASLFNDIVGLEEGRGAHVDDIILALKGHVRDGYKVMKVTTPSPTLQDRVHVLVSVIPADGAVMITGEMVKKMRKIRIAASDMEIPQLAIITKGDKACPTVKDNVENLYKSKYLKEKTEEFCSKLGIPMNCVFLVKNYEKETSLKDDVDAPILCALTQIISFGDDFLNDVKRKEKI